MFFIDGELLHKLDQSSEEKNWIIQIGDKQFQYTKIQIALLSPIGFKHFLHHENPFIIDVPSFLNSDDSVSCFDQLNSLFHSAKELIISVENVQYFSFLADCLDNRFLMKKCKKVNSGQSQIFKLSSKHIFCFPKSWLIHLTDFYLTINENVIGINYSLFSCVCEKLQKFHQREKGFHSQFLMKSRAVLLHFLI
jgi:hypothetical protein